MSGERTISVQATGEAPVGERAFELVERKGLGHPDSICDAIAEAACLSLCREYRERCGRILHFNLDKALLVAGRTEPVFGGEGRILEPIRLVLGDRATRQWGPVGIPVGEIVETAARQWVAGHLRHVVPRAHIRFQNEIKPGSAELTDLFSRESVGANDTSVGVGCAPFSETERLVLAAEAFLNSPGFKGAFPEAGEDVKVMACRTGRQLAMTVAVAFVGRHLKSLQDYFDRKAQIGAALFDHLSGRMRTLDALSVAINALDDPSRGESGVYLTVLGTSAEGGDGGQVGRGNRANGLIAFNRPSSTEAVAGKNPVRHVGKIYNLLAHEIASGIFRRVPGVREATVWLCSRIGRPIDRPLLASAGLVLAPGVTLDGVRTHVADLIEDRLAGIQGFTDRLARGEYPEGCDLLSGPARGSSMGNPGR